MREWKRRDEGGRGGGEQGEEKRGRTGGLSEDERMGGDR
jgi:hypothetical protein